MASTRSALIVASYEFTDPGLRRLRAPAHDAEALAEVLGDPAIGGFDVQTVVNRPAHEVDVAVERFFSTRSPDDLLLLHFSGHGVKDESGDLYFAASDTELGLLGATAVSADFVNRLMARTRSRRVVLLLDCCYAGAFERGLGTRGGDDLQLMERLGGRGRAVITASTAMEYAFEGTDLADDRSTDPSVFTSAVVDALRTGEADTDQDGLIGLDELYDYVYDRVRRVTPNQTPSKWTLGLQGELYLARRRHPVTEPSPLPPEIEHALASPLASVRVAVVQELVRFRGGSHAGLALAAHQALTTLADDDSRTVARAAAHALATAPDPAAPALEPSHPIDAPAPASRETQPEPLPPREEAPEPATAREDRPEPLPAREEAPEPATAREDRPEPLPPREDEPGPSGSRRVPILVAAGVGVVVMVAALVWGLTRGEEGPASATMPEESLAVAVRDDGPRVLSRVAVDGSEETVVLEAALTPLLPTISPDRTTILYWSDETGTVRAIDPDGTDDRPFLDPAEGCTESQRPAWSPDGERLAFACEDSAGSRLLELDSSGAVVQELQATGTVTGSPTWTEVGDREVVVYMTVADDDGLTQLWWTDPDSGEGGALVQDTEHLSHPDAADGRLLYVRKVDENPMTEGELVVKPLSLTGDPDPDFVLSGVRSAAWSPDGDRIAYVGGDDGLWVTSPEESDEPVSVPVEGTPGPPAWGSR